MSGIKMQNKYSCRTHQGQGILEYSLIGVLLLVVCIGGLEIFNGQMSKTWQKLWDDMKSRQGSAVAITGPSSPSAPFTPPSRSSRAEEGQQRVTNRFVTQKGTVITLPDTVDTMEETVKTLGANGTTMVLANSLEALIDQLAANNELNKTQAQKLITLANQGHKLAKLQKLAEDIVANTATTAEYRALMESNPKIMYISEEGLYSLHMGYYYPVDMDPLNPYANLDADGVVGEFLKTYHAAVASGALDDPAVRAVVETLTRKISNLNTVTALTLISLADDEISHSDVSGLIVENIDKTHDSSAKICTTGKGQDSGTQCNSRG
jgi:Flp pilus assembly pilin Flp